MEEQVQSFLPTKARLISSAMGRAQAKKETSSRFLPTLGERGKRYQERTGSKHASLNSWCTA